MFKRGTIVILAFLLMVGFAYGVVPGKMSYEGRLLDASGLPVTVEKTITFGIYDAVRDGNQLWASAPYAVTPDLAGVFSVNLGSNADPIDPRIFNGAERYLEITVNGEKLDPRTQLTAVAFAYKAVDAETVGGVSASDLVKVTGGVIKGSINIEENVTAKSFSGDGSALTNINVSDASISNAKIADGAVTDAKIVSVSASKITGSIPGTQVTGTIAPGPHAAAHHSGGTDSLADYYMQKTGDTVTGTITSSATTALQSSAGNTLTLKSNGTLAIGIALDAIADKLLSVRNNGVEKAQINYAGNLAVCGNFYPYAMQGQANQGLQAYYGLNLERLMFGMYNTYTGTDAGAVGVVGSGTSTKDPAILLDTLNTIPAGSGLKIVSIRNNKVERASVDADGNFYVAGRVGVGIATPEAALDISSTTSGFLPPRMKTSDRNSIASPAEGMLIYNFDTHRMNYYNGSVWVEM